MKKQLLLILATGAVGSMFAQLPASHTPSNKKALLEEFTGIHCGYCPDGHEIATGLVDANPDNVILMNIHSGSFASASTGEPDFKTSAGNSIDAMPGMGITGYPAGDVNRTVLVGSAIAAGRGNWSGMVSTILTEPAYCNVALQGTLDATSRVLTVEAEVYYTASSPAASNFISIMLLENNVLGPQSNYGSPLYNIGNYEPDGVTYNHNHVLRKAITSTFGNTIGTTTSGASYTTSLTYTVPTTYGATGKTTVCNLNKVEIIGFVTESSYGKVINAARGTMKMINVPASMAGVGEISKSISDVSIYPNPAKNNTSVSLNLIQNETVTVNVYSIMGQVVYSQTLSDLTVGNHMVQLNTENWANGMYNVNISTNTGSVNRKIEVAH